MSPPALRPFWNTWDFRGGEWTPSTLKDAALKAAGLGYSGIQMNFEWAWMQNEGAESADFATADWAVKVARACGMKVALGIDHSAPPPWLDAEQYCVRDEGGKLLGHGDTHIPMVAQNSRQVMEWVGGFLKNASAHFGNSVEYIQGISTPLGESTWRHSSKKLFDHSKWATEAYRSWIRSKYIDIRTLNETWDCQYKSWDEVEAGEGPRRATMADFHAFRYSTLAGWTDRMCKSVHEGCGSTKYAFRAGCTRWQTDMQQLSFDLGRYARHCDILLADGAYDQFVINAVRAAAESQGKLWGIRLDRSLFEANLEQATVDEDLGKWGKSVYALGGFADVADWVLFPGQSAPTAPADWANGSAWTFMREVRRQAEMPPPGPKNNRRAIYISAAEVQFWDGTDFEAGRNRWLEVTDSGKKPQYDPISDGVFANSPDTLKRYTAGVEVPFAKVIAKDTRAAFVQAMRLGVRLMVYNNSVAGTMDEHGKPQTQLVM